MLPGMTAGSLAIENPSEFVRAKTGADAPAGRAHLIRDWTTLTGTLVEIRHRDRTVRGRRVECVASNGTTLWIEANGVEPRTMFTDHEDFTVWINTGLRST